MDAAPPGWYSRGYLPHYDDGEKVQSITYRLADSLPVDVVAMLDEQALDDERRRAEIEGYLDAGHGSCILREHGNASIVVGAWRHFDGARCRLQAWCVMPNHVHVMIAPIVGYRLSDILQSEKSYTAKAILRQSPGSAGLRPASARKAGGTPTLPHRQVWQPDYYDRFIRNEPHYAASVDYIHQNPVKAGLVSAAEDWPWSSARDRERGRPARLG
jgi:putative transposase